MSQKSSSAPSSLFHGVPSTFTIFCVAFGCALVTLRFASVHSSTVSEILVPSISTHRVDFREYEEFEDLSASGDQVWNGLLTENGGFLISEDENGASIRHGIAMFHQLHCLQIIRGALQTSQHDKQAERGSAMSKRDQEETNGAEEGHKAHSMNGEHLVHCLDYLRQVVLCLADDTIELPKVRKDGHYAIDGMVPHQCRDSDRLYKLSNDSPPYTPRIDKR